MEEYEKEIDRIRMLLGSHPEGLSITDISGLLQLNRNSVAKYMDILQTRGAADGRKRGTSKVYYASERLLVSCIQKVCTRPFLILSQDLLVTEASPGFLRIAQVTPDQILQKHVDSVPIRFTEAGLAKNALTAAMRGTEQRIRANIIQGSRTLPASLRVVPVVFETGRPGVCIMLEEQEGDRDPAYAAPQDSGLAGLLDDQLEFVVRHTSDGIIWFVNEPYCRAVGKTKEELIGRPFKPLVSPEDSRRITAHLRSLTPQYPVGSIEYRAVMANGESRYQHWQDRALFNNRNELTGYNSCGMDITDHAMVSLKLKKTQETLEESILSRTEDLRSVNRQLYDEISRREKTEEQLQLTQFAMDHAADLIFWINRNARIQYANTRASEVLGYSLPELTEKSLEEIAPGYPRGSWDPLWEELRRGKAISMETALLRCDGSRFSAEVQFTFLAYHGREFVYCFARDITERTRMERALTLANTKLNVLTSLARHDIQNKITVLIGYLGRMKKATSDPLLLGYLERQERAARAISTEINLTREFKDLGRQPPEWQNLKAIITSAVEKHSGTGISFQIQVPECEVYADTQLDRVFQRLLTAAAREENAATKVEISSGFPDRDLEITISDDGKGIPPEDRDQLFELQGSGAGIPGLFIVREILSLTGIIIAETGEFGKGARFVIRIPATYYRFPSEIVPVVET